MVSESVLLLYFPALLLLPQQREDLLELVVLLPVPAQLPLQRADAVDGAVVLQGQLVVENAVGGEFLLLPDQLAHQPVDLLQKGLGFRLSLLLAAALASLWGFLSFLGAD